MPLDVQAVQRACRGSEVTSARQLCRAELDKFRAAVAAGAPLTIGCTQEAPLFAETAEGVDIRHGQYSRDSRLVRGGRAGRP